MSKMNLLPDVGRMVGLDVSLGLTPQDSFVSLQYNDHKYVEYELKMSFLDAMYLLSLLRSLQIESDFSMPDDPRL
jgi:hypothetical protein